MNSNDRLIRVGTAAAVLLVAAIAATVSFVHIEELAVTHGQTFLAALLLPLSIDGTVAAASLVMLRAARMGLPTPALARFMLTLAVVATLAANIGYGLPYGVPGALLSGWPAVAFIGCAEMAILMVRRARPAIPKRVPAAAKPRRERGVQRLKKEIGVGQDKAKVAQRIIREEVSAALATQNGHGEH